MFTLSRIAVTAKASAIFTCIVAAAAAAGDISGIPRIVDGDTVQIAGTNSSGFLLISSWSIPDL
jgi:hypothetical protein